MKHIALHLPLLASVLLLGCTSPSSGKFKVCGAVSTWSRMADGIQWRIALPKKTFVEQDPIPFSLHVVNSSPHVLRISHTHPQMIWHVNIMNSDGNTFSCFPESVGHYPTGALVVGPNESLEYSFHNWWSRRVAEPMERLRLGKSAPLPPGEYSAFYTRDTDVAVGDKKVPGKIRTAAVHFVLLPRKLIETRP